MKGRTSSDVMAILAQGMAVICGCLLALLIALSLTLFREGYYLHKLEKSGCLQTIYENILQGGHTIAETAGLRADILDPVVTQEAVRVSVIRRADELWHGSTTQPETPYEELVAYLQDTVSRETGVAWNAGDTDRYDTVRRVCNDMWTSNVTPPLANMLNILMQYRQVAWVLMAVLAVLVGFFLWFQIPFQPVWKRVPEAVATVGNSVALGCMLICLGIQLSGWQSWMSNQDTAYGLYLQWVGGLGPVVAACGMMLAVLLWCISLLLEQSGRTVGRKSVRPAKQKEDFP